MIKTITLLSTLLLSGCSTYYEMKNCDPAKNYINSNPEAMEKYKELVKRGEVRSYYLKIIPMESCTNNKCLTYDTSKYDFQELYFNDSKRKGIYTIKVTSEKTEPNCIKILYSSDTNCYTVIKNENDSIKSNYYLENIRHDKTSYIKFTDLKNNIVLFETAFQAYHIPNFAGAPSGGLCPAKKNHQYYKFNVLDYP